MGKQRTFARIAWSQKGKVTRRERFLAETDAVIPWAELLALEGVLYGDQAYWKESDRQALEARGVRYGVNRRAAAPHRPLTTRWLAINRARSRTRARGEHPFHVVKRLEGVAKVRYRGLAKNLARAFNLFALANLYLVRHQLLPPAARSAL
jgi:IS5 family transposase